MGQIIIQLLILVVGFIMLVKGADFFVDGAAGVASKLGIPQLVIGLTIVALGTSAPEAAVSLAAAFHGNAAITIGNVVGSNILNILVILGLTAVIVPLHVKKSTAMVEMPFVIVISILLSALGLFDEMIGFADGCILWIGMILFLIYLFQLTKKGEDGSKAGSKSEDKAENGSEGKAENGSEDKAESGSEDKAENGSEGKAENGSEGKAENESEDKAESGSEGKAENGSKVKSEGNSGSESAKITSGEKNVWLLLVMIVGGMALIIAGSNVAVSAATRIAEIFGVEERIIGLTIVALGTSLPELVTSVTAGLKGNADIAVGNIVGSNIFNILFVVGTTALITPVTYSPAFLVDSLIMIATTILLWILAFPKKTLGRIGGGIMLLIYGGYLAWLLHM